MNLLRSLFSQNKKLNDYGKEILIDTCLVSVNFLVHRNVKGCHKSLIVELLRIVKNYLLTHGPNELVSLEERWHLAYYYCSLFELDEVKFKDYLTLARQLIVVNPHPIIYRAILMNLFRTQTKPNRQSSDEDETKKLSYLLETQSIALRHKAYAIHMKHRRKSSIDPSLSENFVNSISFKHSSDLNHIQSFMQRLLPKDLCVLALVLVPEEMDLYLVRLEKSVRPFISKFKYNRKYTDEFKQIMIENDKSMKQSDRNKFWNSRNSLNTRLSAFVNEIETSVFASKKALFMGSYVDFDTEAIIEEFRKKLGASVIMERGGENEQLVWSVLLGLEFYSSEDLRNILKTIFSGNEKVVEIAFNFLNDVIKPRLEGAKRKHVCLLNDKVSALLTFSKVFSKDETKQNGAYIIYLQYI